MRELSVAIVGLGHLNEDGSRRNSELEEMPPGTPLELRREPRNKADPHAVGVWVPGGIRVGYVPAERAPFIGARLAKGEEVRAIFQELLGAMGVARVRIGGGDPTLPRHADPATVPWPTFDADPDGPTWGA
jgi:hypothetical protein